MHVAVVTGGASGIGRAICRDLAAVGDAVAVLDLDGDAAEHVAAEVRDAGGSAIAAPADVADRSSVDEAIGKVRGELGPIGILVTSAGTAEFMPFAEISASAWARVIGVNLTGTFHCAQAVLSDMVEARWGRVVTISSSSAQLGSPRMVHYAASKGGVIALTRALAREYAPFGITANDIAPSAIDTPMQQRWVAEGRIPSNDVTAQRIPLGRLGSPDDIAAACAFLCSEAAGYITGQVLGVNGGSVL